MSVSVDVYGTMYTSYQALPMSLDVCLAGKAGTSFLAVSLILRHIYHVMDDICRQEGTERMSARVYASLLDVGKVRPRLDPPSRQCPV